MGAAEGAGDQPGSEPEAETRCDRAAREAQHAEQREHRQVDEYVHQEVAQEQTRLHAVAGGYPQNVFGEPAVARELQPRRDCEQAAAGSHQRHDVTSFGFAAEPDGAGEQKEDAMLFREAAGGQAQKTGCDGASAETLDAEQE
jgi:hypothetical protein